jgi:tetratricopeptide (TPR) repeat protein
MEQFKAILEQTEALARQYVNDILATESGRITAAVVFAAVVGILLGLLISRPTKKPTREAVPVTPAPPALPVEPVLVAAPPPRSPTSAYRAMLEARGVPENEINGRVRSFAEQVDSFRQAMAKLAGESGDTAALVDEARRNLESGDFDKTMAALETIAARHGETARRSRDTARGQFGLSAAALEVLGDLQVALDDFAAGAARYREAVETLPDKPANGLVGCLNKHGTAAYNAGDYVSATASFDRVRKILEKSLGIDHPDVATALNNLALMYYEQGDYAAAEPLYRRALAIDEKALGPQHVDVATDLNNLALLYMNQGNFEAAEPMFSRSVAIKERSYQLGHPSLVTGLRNYAILLRSIGRAEEAATLEARAQAKPAVRTRPPVKA